VLRIDSIEIGPRVGRLKPDRSPLTLRAFRKTEIDTDGMVTLGLLTPQKLVAVFRASHGRAKHRTVVALKSEIDEVKAKREINRKGRKRTKTGGRKNNSGCGRSSGDQLSQRYIYIYIYNAVEAIVVPILRDAYAIPIVGIAKEGKTLSKIERVTIRLRKQVQEIALQAWIDLIQSYQRKMHFHV